MNNLTLIKSENFEQIQCDFWQDENKEIWVTREQIGKALGYADPDKAIANIHDRNRDRLDKFSTILNLRKVEGNREVSRQIIAYNYKGIYEICRFSRQPKADAFMDWVWDVIESIRKHGAYLTPEKIEEVLLNPDTIIQLATQLKQEREEKLKLEEKVKADKPKVLFADSVAISDTAILIGELAKLLKQNGIDIGEKRLFEWMRSNGYLISRKGTDYNMPTQRSMELGLFRIKETSITHSDGHVTISKTAKVTGKGQIYFINKFKSMQEINKENVQ